MSPPPDDRKADRNRQPRGLADNSSRQRAANSSGAKTVESGRNGSSTVGHDGDFLCWSGRSAEPRGSLLEVVQFRSKVRDSASYRSCRRGVPARSRWSTLLESVLERIWFNRFVGA